LPPPTTIEEDLHIHVRDDIDICLRQDDQFRWFDKLDVRRQRQRNVNVYKYLCR
jgi:hypothetical protein